MAIGKVIKGDTATPEPARPAAPAPKRSVLDSENFEARQEAQAIVERARRQAAEIIAEAEAQKEVFVDEGREIGRQEVLAQAEEIKARAHLVRDQMLLDAKDDILELALKVAEKIIGRDLERDPEIIVDICATAIETTRANKAMVLKMNPADAAVLRENQKDLLGRVGQLVAIAIKEDPEVGQGGVIIQTDGGTTDAQLDTQIEMLRQVLLNADEDHDQEESES